MAKKKILLLTSEISPFSSTYQLADFSKKIYTFLNDSDDFDGGVFQMNVSSDIYDIRLKTRLGDLSGLINSRLGDSVNLPITNPGYGLASENVYLSGEIKANSGSIGGIKMHNNKLFTGDVATFGSTNTGFYLDSDGQLSLKDKLKWDGTTLRITGSLAVVAGEITSLNLLLFIPTSLISTADLFLFLFDFRYLRR